MERTLANPFALHAASESRKAWRAAEAPPESANFGVVCTARTSPLVVKTQWLGLRRPPKGRDTCGLWLSERPAPLTLAEESNGPRHERRR